VESERKKSGNGEARVRRHGLISSFVMTCS
jgi:hypothetical protein